MKNILKETFLFIVIIVVIVLMFCILFYKDMPTNKVVPETVQYTLPSNLQQELNNTLEESQEVIVTYTVTDKDMNAYENTSSYNPGKINPFAVYQSQDNSSVSNGSTNSTSAPASSSNGSKVSSNKTSSSSLFENSATK